MDISTYIGAVVTLASAVLGAYLANRFIKDREPKVKITRIKNVKKQRLLLEHVWNLYEKRLPPDERTDPENILRWIREGRKKVYFLVASYKETINIARGLFIFTYNDSSSKFPFAFISYLVTYNPTKGERLEIGEESLKINIRNELCVATEKILKKEIKDCKGMVAELDDPLNSKSDVKRKKEAENRITHFKSICDGYDFPFIEIDNVDYKQPALIPNGSQDDEVPLKLIFIPTQEGKKKLTKNEVKALISGIYDVYSTNYQHDKKLNIQYRRYIADLKKRVLETIR